MITFAANLRPKFIIFLCQNIYKMIGSISDKIRKRIGKAKAGKILFSSDFAALGSPEAVKKAMLRLCNAGTIMRLSNGIYYKPKYDKELNLGLLLPTLDDVARAIAERDMARIVPTGDYALNCLGLSTQVPANVVYLTDGSPRHIAIGKGRGITFKHSSEMRLFCYRSNSMMLIVSAMRTIGEKQITEEQMSILTGYLQHVSDSDYNHDIRLAPIWVRRRLKRFYVT